MEVSVEPRPQGSGPAPANWPLPPPVAPGERRIWRRIVGLLGLVAAVLWNFMWLAGMAWLYDSSTGAQFAESVGGLAFLQFAVLVLGFVFCLAGTPFGLRLATMCAAGVFVLVLAIGVIGALAAGATGDYWVFGVVFAIPDLFLVAGIAVMNPRIWAKISKAWDQFTRGT